MPEGDTIYRTARTLHRALAGRKVTAFETGFAHLAVVHENTPITERTVERVEARGKHLLMRFSGGLTLRTHMRMSGSWHVYRPGEPWQRARSAARVVVGTDAFVAVGFNVPVAEFVSDTDAPRDAAITGLGPDLLAETFDVDEAVDRLRTNRHATVAEALLDQRAVAGIGNVFKSELLFLAGLWPFAAPADVTPARWRAIVDDARRLLRANVVDHAAAGFATSSGMRRTTGRLDPRARLWVYERQGRPCRRCGTRIEMRRQGDLNRSTYFCPACQKKSTPGTEDR
jgi:endonuclease-8